MKNLLRIAALVVATTLAARAAAATNPEHAPRGSCFPAGGFSKCADLTSWVSPSEFFGTFLTSADVFVSSLPAKGKDGAPRHSEVNLSTKKCGDGAKSGADVALCPAADVADLITPEPPGMVLMAIGLLGLAALELWRRSQKT